jgi:chemotaxis signal transduction protein
VSTASPIANRATDLRDAFDKSYAARRVFDEAYRQLVGFLTIRISGDAYAIRLEEISGLAKGRKIVACPSRVAEFQGLAGVRGALVCVYSLPALLGYAMDVQQAPWLLLCGGDELIGFSFVEFEGYTRADASRIHSANDEHPRGAARGRATQVLSAGGQVRAIVSVPWLKQQIQRGSQE